MLFVLIITILFVLASIYFFFRAEKLQKKILLNKREGFAIRKENKKLTDSMSLVSLREEEFSKAKLQRIRVYAMATENKKLLAHTELISPLVNNYSLIFRECLKGRGRLKAICQKCFETHGHSAYKNFVAMIVTSDKTLKRYWASDNLNGYLFLIDALLTIEHTKPELSASADTKVVQPQVNVLIT